jgi:PKD repeat protein
MVLDPNFPTQPYVYVRYVYDPPGITPDEAYPRVQRIERITANLTNTNLASTAVGARTVLLGRNGDATVITAPGGGPGENRWALTCWRDGAMVEDCIPADSFRHVGGSLAFGPDGALYSGVGDVDRTPTGPQTVGTLIGSLLRIDPTTGDGLATNPFYNGNPASNVSKVFAHGFRNPFRAAIHPVTGQIIVGDVGADTWEELDSVTAGGNYGWPCREGFQPYYLFADTATCLAPATKIDPIVSWVHEEGAGGAAVVGDWYRGSIYPAQYQGAFFFGDYSQQFIRYAKPNGAGGYDVFNFATAIGGNSIVALRYAPDGYLYWVDLLAGTIHRIGNAGVGNVPPTAVATASATEGTAPLGVAFNGAGSSDPDGQALTYAWAFGDGATSTLVSPSHTYMTNGVFTARLTVTDTTSRSSSATIVIRVGTAPTITINTPANNTIVDVGTTVNFTATATDSIDGNLNAQIQWAGSLHHNAHIHPNVFSASGPSGSFVMSDHDDDTYIELCASVTNSLNQTTRTCTNVYPTTVQLTIDSQPRGLMVTYQSSTRATPFTVIANKGVTRALIAPSTGGACSFDHWSDGGLRQHDLVVGQPATYVASFACPYGSPSLITTAPVRVLETRADAGQVGYTGTKPAAGQTVELRLGSAIPANATAVLVNLTGTDATAAGYPCGQSRPTTSNLNLQNAGTDTNLALIPLGTNRAICIYTETGTHLIADLFAYLT